MRTTIRLDARLLTEAKKIAADTGGTLTSVIEEALQESLRRRRRPKGTARPRLPRHAGKLRAGIDLDDSAALLDIMEKR